jgi:hypothetical protein
MAIEAECVHVLGLKSAVLIRRTPTDTLSGRWQSMRSDLVR